MGEEPTGWVRIGQAGLTEEANLPEKERETGREREVKSGQTGLMFPPPRFRGVDSGSACPLHATGGSLEPVNPYRHARGGV